LMFARLALRLPIVGSLIGDRETARFARTLATLTQNGVSMLDAMRITSSVMGNGAYAIGVREIGESLKEGRVLSVPMAASGLFSELAVRLTGIGEQTGQLTQMLMQVATIYEATLQRQLARLMSLVTPILTLVIGALVGGLILSVMNAILSVNELVFK
jgi:general secretion pathway protein F